MNFSTTIQRFGVQAVKGVNRKRRAITLKLFSSVILDTPVLTGRLRGAWVLTEGSPSTAKPDLSHYDKSGGTTVSALVPPIEKSTGDTELFLTNNVPYGPKIEFEGWSKRKAPYGMVRRNVQRIANIIHKIDGGAP